MIVVDCGLNCKSYQEKEEEIIEMLSRAGFLCPVCRHALVLHSGYDRQVIEGDGSAEHILIHVAMCGQCRKSQSLLPSFVMPHKHYSGMVIEAVIKGIDSDGSFRGSACPADDSTIRRWKEQFQERGNTAAGWLKSLAWELYQKVLSVIILQGLSLFRQLERLLWEVDVKRVPSGGIIGRVNQYITAYGKGYI
jgi:hypothetical protein